MPSAEPLFNSMVRANYDDQVKLVGMSFKPTCHKQSSNASMNIIHLIESRRMFTKIPKSDLVRKVRPLQRIVAPLIIEDVIAGQPPSFVKVACKHYSEALSGRVPSNARQYDAGPSARGDIRELAIEWLLLNGFAKGKAVKFDGANTLTNWTSDRDALEVAADLEIEHGSNRSWAKLAEETGKTCEVRGAGPRAVYLYTDSRLDQLGDKCTKIGRHHHSGIGDVAGRVAQQYATGNPGMPVLRFLFAVENDAALETYLHRHFKDHHVKNGVGKEWFEVTAEEVAAAAQEYLKGPLS